MSPSEASGEATSQRLPSGPAGIREVAARAGVSVGTVSNAINRPHVVADATRERVQRAMAELGFVRNNSARQLRAGSSSVLGVMVLDMGNPFWGEVVRGIEAVASASGHTIMVCSSDESPQKEQRNLEALLEHRVNGLLIAPVRDDEDRFEAFRRRDIDVVMLDHVSTSPGIASVAVDDVHGGHVAAAHLLERGHERIALVNADLAIAWCADRRDGVHRAVAGRGRDPLTVVRDLPVPALTARAGEGIVDALLELRPRPTAVVCANDLLALGVLRGLTRRGVRVPDDMALVGYDDVDFAAVLSPPLTTVRQEPYRVGRTAVELLLDSPSPRSEPRPKLLFRPELVVRDSA